MIESPELGKRLASCVEALQALAKEQSEILADFKARREVLQNEVGKLSHDILFGQEQLPLESVAEAIADMQKLAEESGNQVTLQMDGGKEVVLPDGTKGRKRRGKEAAAGDSE